MAPDDMSIEERYQYLRRMQARYRAASREEKKTLLDEMVAYTGLHRKSVIRRMKGPIEHQARCRERDKTYGPEVDAALDVIWETLDYICPLRLKPNLVSTGQALAKHHELHWSPQLEAQLDQISVSSIRRHLPPRPLGQRQRKPAKPLNRHQQQIPAYRIPRDIAEPGHFEVDLVHHCGRATEGEYVYTLQMIDVATGWGGRRAMLGRSYIVVADALAYLLAQFPFPVLELHPDNGSEFLNTHLLAFLDREYADPQRSRSRPGCPNDNRLVEEKNSSIVRHYLGDRRFDTVTQTRFLNRIYDKLYIYHNYFIPVLKQIAKEWIPGIPERPGYLRRQHDPARTPLDRLCDLQAHAVDAHCHVLRRQREAINPRQLRNTIYADLDHLFAYPGATPGQVESIYETLADPERFPEAVAALRIMDRVPNSQDGLPVIPTVLANTRESEPFPGKEMA